MLQRPGEHKISLLSLRKICLKRVTASIVVILIFCLKYNILKTNIMKATRLDINYDRNKGKKLTALSQIHSLILVLDTGGSSEEKYDALAR